jgi:hypothetical protein
MIEITLTGYDVSIAIGEYINKHLGCNIDLDIWSDNCSIDELINLDHNPNNCHWLDSHLKRNKVKLIDKSMYLKCKTRKGGTKYIRYSGGSVINDDDEFKMNINSQSE